MFKQLSVERNNARQADSQTLNKSPRLNLEEENFYNVIVGFLLSNTCYERRLSSVSKTHRDS